MINNTNIKIFLTLILFIIGGFYIHYSLDHGLIKANIKTSKVMADCPGCDSNPGGGK